MASKGRKRKAGLRTKADRIRKGPDKGCDGYQRRNAKHGPDSADALGRAYNAGLLGDDERAMHMRDMGRAFTERYHAIYGRSPRDSLARFQEDHGHAGLHEHDRELTQRLRLNRAIYAITQEGMDVRRAFYSLVVECHPDEGPAWIDALIAAKRRNRTLPAEYLPMLDLAMKGLEILC